MGLFGTQTDRMEQIVEDAVRRVLSEVTDEVESEMSVLSTVRQLRQERDRLQDQIAELERARKEQTREIEHKVGLAKIRQEAEAEIAETRLENREQQLEREQGVAVKEAKVAAREEAMKRADELLGQQVERMEKLVDTLVGALPRAEMIADFGSRD